MAFVPYSSTEHIPINDDLSEIINEKVWQLGLRGILKNQWRVRKMNLLDAVIRAGEKSIIKQSICVNNGGHHQDIHTTCNGKLAWRCRCGFLAPKTAPIWEKK
jgi:hypothetical protein